MSYNFKNKKVFLTGSTGTIGKTIAEFFSKSGANLICTGTNENKLNDLKNNIGNNHKFYKFDINNIDDLEKNIDIISNDHKDIDIIVNNAGYNADMLSIKMKNEQWDKVININLSSHFKIIKKFIPNMIKNKGGRIIGISSIVAFTGNKGQANYSASKSGMIGLYKSLALEYASRNITINIIAPGFIESNMTDKLDENQKKSITDRIPISRLGTSKDVANGVLFLSSDDSSYITGQTLHINGGLLMV